MGTQVVDHTEAISTITDPHLLVCEFGPAFRAERMFRFPPLPRNYDRDDQDRLAVVIVRQLRELDVADGTRVVKESRHTDEISRIDL